jgi:phospholipid/cholesterol/gamma-HCH transport system permease protein
MVAIADFIEEQVDQGAVLRFTGRLTLARIGDIPKRLKSIATPPDIIDISNVERMDTVGAWIVHKLSIETGAQITGASKEALRLIDLVDDASVDVLMRPAPPNPIIRVLGEIGEAVSSMGKTLLGLLGFFGAIVIALWQTLLHPCSILNSWVFTRSALLG